ncbi:MAG: nucleoside triphosphate pyrophosphohydrolase [Anaerovoracaceae bacterium]
MYDELKKPAQSSQCAFERLISIVELLRKKCPWDIEQTHESLRMSMIEEAYEACEAIDKKDTANLREELGDVLLQVVFHSSIAKEEQKFDIIDVVNEECEKMIRRHPHVFSTLETKTVDKVLDKWENVKSQELDYNTHTEVLESVPKALPSLIRSMKIQQKASRAGFDWDDIECVFDKVYEETEEVKEALERESADRVYEEIGDLLFSVVNLSRFLKINPEEALERANCKFIKRFAFVEDSLMAKGESIEEVSNIILEGFWKKSKEDSQ